MLPEIPGAVLSPVKGHGSEEARAPPPPPPEDFDPSREEAPLPPRTPDADEEEGDDDGLDFDLGFDEVPDQGASGLHSPTSTSQDIRAAAGGEAPPAAPQAVLGTASSGGVASLLEAAAEAQLASSSPRGSAAASAEPEEDDELSRSSPTLTVEEIYAIEEQRLSTPFQRRAYKQLREWDDEVEGRFSAKQAVNLAKQLAAVKQAKEAGHRERSWSELASCTCITLIWIVLAALVLLVPMTIGGVLSRNVYVQSNGAVAMTTNDGLAAAANVLTQRGLRDLSVIPEEELRKIRDCTFVHRGALHRLRVASLVRSANGAVQLVSPDHSSLKINRGGDGLTMTFDRPFIGEQKVDLADPFNRDLLAGCSFQVMTDAGIRGTPTL
eukprot:TRINITY_DN107218_c0_g1_i1.p1 TRINITY_DN107218_c0_g1~~TRINITY_DN107218_c0_g1_i1.p1  ORF type:complete len:382 (-),score=90.33 TRINITY_DN107218_c0_g1_i1:116-1261(-)